MCYISLERAFYSAPARVCCMEIHADMSEKSQVTDGLFLHKYYFVELRVIACNEICKIYIYI